MERIRPVRAECLSATASSAWLVSSGQPAQRGIRTCSCSFALAYLETCPICATVFRTLRSVDTLFRYAFANEDRVLNFHVQGLQNCPKVMYKAV